LAEIEQILQLQVSFFAEGGMIWPMRYFPLRLRCLCAILLICVGGCGILFAPSVGLAGSREVRLFKLNQAQEHDWGTSIVSSEIELPFISNQRGLVFMNACLAGSVGAIFGGVYWITGLRRRPGCPTARTA
jgi:hypothetical protein